MTDEESRQEFMRTIGHDCDLDLSQNGVDGSFLNDETHYRFMEWQAAVEWATKRERERCAQISRDCHAGEYSTLMAARLITRPE